MAQDPSADAREAGTSGTREGDERATTVRGGGADRRSAAEIERAARRGRDFDRLTGRPRDDAEITDRPRYGAAIRNR